jgi:hypothetical protein
MKRSARTLPSSRNLHPPGSAFLAKRHSAQGEASTSQIEALVDDDGPDEVADEGRETLDESSGEEIEFTNAFDALNDYNANVAPPPKRLKQKASIPRTVSPRILHSKKRQASSRHATENELNK